MANGVAFSCIKTKTQIMFDSIVTETETNKETEIASAQASNLDCQCIQWTLDRIGSLVHDMGIDHGGFHILMAK